jgi:hypothetical protein
MQMQSFDHTIIFNVVECWAKNIFQEEYGWGNLFESSSLEE